MENSKRWQVPFAKERQTTVKTLQLSQSEGPSTPENRSWLSDHFVDIVSQFGHLSPHQPGGQGSTWALVFELKDIAALERCLKSVAGLFNPRPSALTRAA